MITYEKALETARRLLPNLNYCTEFSNAYMFSKYEPTDESYTIGGAGAPVVILKNDGRAITMAYYVGRYSGDYIKDFKVE